MILKNLKELVECDLDITIQGINDDSREVKDGYLFVATKGFNVDHFDFIDDAIKNGASALVISDEKENLNIDIPYIKVSNINKFYPDVCSKFYDIDSNDFSFIGITGTDGKTTSTYIVKCLLDNIKNTAYIGTNGVECLDKHLTSDNTTPCISTMYKYLNFIKSNDCKQVVMEVSSEALLHKRVENLKYKIVGFTNITEDHLNVHKTLENYIECKKSLLNYLSDDGIAIINGDCKNCKTITCKNSVMYGFDLSNDCVISNVKEMSNKTIFNVKYLDNTYKIISPFLGKYNVYNVTLAFLICFHYGLAPEYLVDQISKLKPVSGRREKLAFSNQFDIILDYAHTYNGIVNVIESAKNYKNVIVVTGCAGGREREKRSKIGKYILENCTKAIFTMDDPRFESVDSIIDDMVSLSKIEYIRIISREEAIKKALSMAFELEDCVVLILGKGRDNYMAIKDEKIPYSDYDVVKDYFN